MIVQRCAFSRRSARNRQLRRAQKRPADCPLSDARHSISPWQPPAGADEAVPCGMFVSNPAGARVLERVRRKRNVTLFLLANRLFGACSAGSSLDFFPFSRLRSNLERSAKNRLHYRSLTFTFNGTEIKRRQTSLKALDTGAILQDRSFISA